MRRICMLLALATVPAGCVTVGEEFPTDVKWIQVGKTKRAEVDSKIGVPFRKGYDSGLVAYTYLFYRYSVFKPARTRDLVVRFNNDSSVHSYSFSSSFEEDKRAIP